MKYFKPKDGIAFASIIAFVILKFSGLDGMVDAGFMVILGYYFAKRQEGKDNGK